jgi:hypothetical protein
MNNLDQKLPPIRPSSGSGRALAIFTAVVALAGGCGRAGSSSSGEGAGAGAGSGRVSYAQYNTLTGTFVAPGINAKLTGAMLGGFNMGSSGTHPQTGWNAGGPFAASYSAGALRTPVAVTGEIPEGTKPDLSLSLLTVPGQPAAASYSCMGVSRDGAQPLIFFSLHAANGSLVANYNHATSCTFTLEAPTNVESNAYFAHGSVNATLELQSPTGGKDGTGTLSATW